MVYVIAQFSLLAVIAWPITNLHFSIIGLLLIFIAIVVAVWTLMTNKPGNFNIRPIPKITGELITHGIYRYIRHPMYSSLFFAGLGIIFCMPIWWKLVAWLLLVVTLIFKARFEERALVKHYVGYQAYQKNNKAFIPFIW
ncbi:methyltransferase family protein [Psychromonas hadalis]|uniref:methyltransferase family protein n=1 Tax=Psychromonas hadalis TaxID=211669 RepID=UPI0003B76DDC|nr:isoprenylcysteine carboxylmethyltransferase family protein [Psychromonas hadalis]